MFNLYHDYDPVSPSGSLLLAEVGIDIGRVREAPADDFTRRCPEVPADESWREAREG